MGKKHGSLDIARTFTVVNDVDTESSEKCAQHLHDDVEKEMQCGDFAECEQAERDRRIEMTA
jgi:hypothetical protein